MCCANCCFPFAKLHNLNALFPSRSGINSCLNMNYRRMNNIITKVLSHQMQRSSAPLNDRREETRECSHSKSQRKDLIKRRRSTCPSEI